MASPPELAHSSASEDMEKEKRSFMRSESSQSSSMEHLTEHTQLLKLETITDKEGRVQLLIICNWLPGFLFRRQHLNWECILVEFDFFKKCLATAMKVQVAVCISLAVVVCVIKETRPDLVVLNRTNTILNIFGNAIALAFLLLCYIKWGARVINSIVRKRYWSPRRWKAIQMAQSILLLENPSDFCTMPFRQVICSLVVWFCWNLLLLSLVIDAHGINLREQKGRADGTVRDEPIMYHWPKFVFALGFLGLDVWLILEIWLNNSMGVEVADGGECTWGAEVQCTASIGFYVGSLLATLGMVVYCIMFFVYIARAFRQYQKELYQKYRLGNILVRVQLRVSGSVIGTILLSMLLNWFVGSNTCANFAVIWFGTPSIVLAWMAVAATVMYVTLPRLHRSALKYQAVPSHLMQQFAWTEAEVPRKLERRNSQLRLLSSVMEQEPMFCVEYAIKSFFWSVLAYHYTDVEGATFDKLPERIRELIGEVDTAAELFGLSKRHMFYDRQIGTKVVVAWSTDMILLTARGSAERVNFIEDLKFFQTAHHPKRRFGGRVPRVHRGFQESWHASGIRSRVLMHVEALLDSAEDRAAVRVLCTGHSLGGAVASLAAFDIASELHVSKDRIKLYTFGCPRIGNRALAHHFQQLVPDTWHIINDQDVVTRVMKLFGLYKRHGNRVIVNKQGDMVIRPNTFEASMQQAIRGGSAQDHMTMSYQNALVSIVASQLSSSGRHADGLQGLLGLVQSVPQVKLALESHAKQLGTTLADVMKGVGAQTRRTLGSAGFGAPSKYFSPAGIDAHHMAQARAADKSHPASPSASEASSAANEAVVAVAHLEEHEWEASDDGEVFECGDKAEMQAGAFTHAAEVSQIDGAAGGAMHDTQPAHTTGPQTSCHAAWPAVTAKLLHLQGAKQNAAGHGAAAVPLVHHRCYKIPEDDAAAATTAGGKAAEAAASKPSWHCPLHAQRSHLPPNATLEGNLVTVGAKPDMKGCRLRGSRCLSRAPAQKPAAGVAGSEVAVAPQAAAPKQQTAETGAGEQRTALVHVHVDTPGSTVDEAAGGQHAG